jgi:hypothetical protein
MSCKKLEDIDKAIIPIRESMARLEGELAAMRALFAVKANEVGSLRGVPGEPGPQGPSGERGPRGRDGRAGKDAPVINGLTFNQQDGTFVFRMDDGTRGPSISLFDIFGTIKIDRSSYSIIVENISGGELLRLPLRDLFDQYHRQVTEGAKGA